MKYPFVVIEGIDGSGKTTTAELLAAELNGAFVKTPLSPFAEFRLLYDDCPPEARFLFYLSTVVHASQQITKLIDEVPVVCDRYIRSTLAFHQAMGVDSDLIAVDKLHILIPDFTFCLTVDETMRLDRMVKRGTAKTATEDPDFLQRAFTLLKIGCIEVDTTTRNPQQVAAHIAGIIRSHQTQAGP